jgi:hypothetical protein
LSRKKTKTEKTMGRTDKLKNTRGGKNKEEENKRRKNKGRKNGMILSK